MPSQLGYVKGIYQIITKNDLYQEVGALIIELKRKPTP